MTDGAYAGTIRYISGAATTNLGPDEIYYKVTCDASTKIGKVEIMVIRMQVAEYWACPSPEPGVIPATQITMGIKDIPGVDFY